MKSRAIIVVAFVSSILVITSTIFLANSGGNRSFSSLNRDLDVHLVIVFPDLSFERPVDLQHSGDETNRLFVVEQAGIIRVFDNNLNVSSSTVFLEIKDRVNDAGNEEGLLGLAFHPDFRNNSLFYVYYSASNPRRSVLARYNVSDSNPNQADKNSELILLEVEQPYSNHNGGQIAFGPDGYLYIALGDGGSSGDPLSNGQNRTTLLGSILRIDVNNPASGKNYGIPTDNPFNGNAEGYREEIYAYGFRNPWRFSFDPLGRLWAGDVGQNLIEEIDLIESGKNYGWNIMEGNNCYNPSSGCDTTGLSLPVIDYSHDLGKSVTGGYVYSGTEVPDLSDLYIYGDYVTGRLWALNYISENDVNNTELMKTSLNIASFGVDEDNELYICAFDGKIYKFAIDNANKSSTGSTDSKEMVAPGFGVMTLAIIPLVGLPLNARRSLAKRSKVE
ncbi:MAG: PQQ-dependent sugar dehydrogenase [Candidatus Odinarchaeota archaeon]